MQIETAILSQSPSLLNSQQSGAKLFIQSLKKSPITSRKNLAVSLFWKAVVFLSFVLVGVTTLIAS